MYIQNLICTYSQYRARFGEGISNDSRAPAVIYTERMKLGLTGQQVALAAAPPSELAIGGVLEDGRGGAGLRCITR